MEIAAVDDAGSDSSITTRIVSEVADREGVDPTALDTPLFDAVDPDALATLVDNGADTLLTVSFNYAGYRVTVVADEETTVDVVPLA